MDELPAPYRSRQSGNTLNINPPTTSPPPVNVTFNQTINSAAGQATAVEAPTPDDVPTKLPEPTPPTAPAPSPELQMLAEAVLSLGERLEAMEKRAQQQKLETVGEATQAPDEPIPTEGMEFAPPPPDLDELDDRFTEPPPIGDWRTAIERMKEDDTSEDYGIGMEADLESLPVEEVPMEPQVSKTVVIAEQKTIDDSSWGKAEIAYQVAIQAKNGSAIYRGFLVEPASRRGMSVDDLADEIIRSRHETVQRVMSEF